MKQNTLINAVLAAFLAVSSSSSSIAKAATISIAITATVEDVFDDAFLLGGAISPGDTITGVYTYSTEVPDSNTLPAVGDYQHNMFDPFVMPDEMRPPFGVNVSVNGLTFRSDPDNLDFLVEIGNNHTGQDFYLFRSYNNISDVGEGGMISWQLDDPTQTALSTAGLPTTPPDLSKFEQWFGLDISGSVGFAYYYDIRAVVTSAVLASPQPPQPLSIRASQLEICWDTSTNLYYQLQYSWDLANSQWSPVTEWLRGSGFRSCTFATIPAGRPHRFFRIATASEPPPP